MHRGAGRGRNTHPPGCVGSARGAGSSMAARRRSSRGFPAGARCGSPVDVGARGSLGLRRRIGGGCAADALRAGGCERVRRRRRLLPRIARARVRPSGGATRLVLSGRELELAPQSKGDLRRAGTRRPRAPMGKVRDEQRRRRGRERRQLRGADESHRLLRPPPDACAGARGGARGARELRARDPLRLSTARRGPGNRTGPSATRKPRGSHRAAKG